MPKPKSLPPSGLSRELALSRAAGHMLDEMMDLIPFLGLADIPLQLFERFRTTEIGFDIGQFIVKPGRRLRRRLPRGQILPLRPDGADLRSPASAISRLA